VTGGELASGVVGTLVGVHPAVRHPRTDVVGPAFDRGPDLCRSRVRLSGAYPLGVVGTCRAAPSLDAVSRPSTILHSPGIAPIIKQGCSSCCPNPVLITADTPPSQSHRRRREDLPGRPPCDPVPYGRAPSGPRVCLMQAHATPSARHFLLIKRRCSLAAGQEPFADLRRGPDLDQGDLDGDPHWANAQSWGFKSPLGHQRVALVRRTRIACSTLFEHALPDHFSHAVTVAVSRGCRS
jgi:hypothetical protein